MNCSFLILAHDTNHFLANLKTINIFLLGVDVIYVGQKFDHKRILVLQTTLVTESFRFDRLEESIIARNTSNYQDLNNSL